MRRRNWKRVQPRSQQEAIRLCVDFAQEHHNRSVARIGDLMGTSEWAVYKWLANGSMPSEKIRPFEYACDPQGRAVFVTRYLAMSAQKLVIDIPRGRKASEVEVAELQSAAADAVALLARCYRGDAEADDTVAALTRLLEGAAWHRENITKAGAPELDLFEGDPE